jgi:hypothetical protein
VGHAAQVDPAVANGVVYLTDGLRNTTIYAFSATCATGGRTCSPLWHRGGLVLSDPTVAGGEVWAAGGAGLAPATLYAFGLPPQLARAGSAGGRSGAARWRRSGSSRRCWRPTG